MRVGALGIGNLVDIEEHGAWNVLGKIVVATLPVLGRQVPGGIDDDEVRRFELALKLVRSA